MSKSRTIHDRVSCRIPKALRDAGGDIYSTCVSFHYPRNGNADNPTPILTYVATLKGQTVAMVGKLRVAKEILADTIADSQTVPVKQEDSQPRSEPRALGSRRSHD